MKKNKPHIDLNNYEVFVIDYLDGKLTPDGEVALQNFLIAHPDIRDEMDGLELAVLEIPETQTDFAQSLKKTEIVSVGKINDETYETFFFAAEEHDLNKLELNDLKAFLNQNTGLQAEFDLHKKLILQADQNIVFTDKASLKRKRAISPVQWISFAATLLMLAALYFFLAESNKPLNQNFGVQTFDHRITRTIANDLNEKNSLPKRVVEAIPLFTTNNSDQQLTAENEILPTAKLTMSTLISRHTTTTTLENETVLLPAYSFADESFGYDLALAETPEPTKDKSMLGKVIGRQWDLFTSKLSGNKERKINRQLQETEPGYIKLIDRSILVFNTLTGSETHVEKTYNHEGRLTDYKVSGNTMYVSREIESAHTP